MPRKSTVRTDALTLTLQKADRHNRSAPTSSSHTPWPNPHSARGTAADHFPRFRALALFGRRPPQPVEGIVIPAAENLHNSRHPDQLNC